MADGVGRSVLISFQGELFDYQREGLKWLEFLREGSAGGCSPMRWDWEKLSRSWHFFPSCSAIKPSLDRRAYFIYCLIGKRIRTLFAQMSCGTSMQGKSAIAEPDMVSLPQCHPHFLRAVASGSGHVPGDGLSGHRVG